MLHWLHFSLPKWANWLSSIGLVLQPEHHPDCVLLPLDEIPGRHQPGHLMAIYHIQKLLNKSSHSVPKTCFLLSFVLQLDEQVSRLQREKNDTQSRMEEDQEDMNELMKKHKAAVAQVTPPTTSESYLKALNMLFYGSLLSACRPSSSGQEKGNNDRGTTVDA